MSYEPHHIYETLMYDSLLHWPIYNPSYTEDDPVGPPPISGNPPISTPGTGTSGISASTADRRSSTQEENRDSCPSTTTSNAPFAQDPSIIVEDSGVASPVIQPYFGSRLGSSSFARWLLGTTPSLAPPPRTSGRSQGRGGEWRIGDFGYCANGTFKFSRNVEDFLCPDDPPLSYSPRGAAWCYQMPLQRGKFGSATIKINASSPPCIAHLRYFKCY
ncbi:hypothetical protein BT69DRAFT_681708 [Atractiella rhizophila]|nr:hypothetical protein BT69DRAFT_681708 [Atractiella rhizophila]